MLSPSQQQTVIEQTVTEQTRQWLQTAVVGLNLCPFAKPVVAAGTLRIAVATATDRDSLLRNFLHELDRLQQSDESEIATTLLVVAAGLESFADYLDLVDIANDLIEQVGLLGTVQVATFHPDYQFDGEPAEAVSHYTNRSPYPVLHLLREAAIATAVAAHPDAEAIPAHNIARLERLGRAQIEQLWAAFSAPSRD
jgi:hypothetical protein